MDDSDNTILVESSVSLGSHQPMVVQSYQGNTVTMSAEAAKQRAIAILVAIAYADTEAAIFTTMAGLSTGKGFKQPAQKDLRMAAQFVQIMRSSRSAFPPGISAIFGYKARKPLVILEWDDVKIQLELHTALHHANALLQASEAAQTDSFLYQFASSQLGLEHEEIQVLVKEFMLHRERTRVEATFES